MAKKTTPKTTGRGARSTTGRGEETGVAVQEMPQTKRGTGRGPTHDQIALRAQEIWKRHGCPPGEDKENWLEAEVELKREMGIQ